MVSLHAIAPNKFPLAVKELEVNLALLRERRVEGGSFLFTDLDRSQSLFFLLFFLYPRKAGSTSTDLPQQQ